MLSRQHDQKLRRNFIAFGIDFIAFGVAINFISPTTVLPAFATRLGASDALVGLLVTVFYLAWDLPQVIAGNIIARVEHKKPALMRAATIGRPAILLFALFLFLTGGEPFGLSIALLFAALAILFSTDAFAALAWFDLLGRVFPSEKRGGYLALWQIFRAVLALGVFYLVSLILSERGPDFPYNYGLLFLFGSAGMLISWIALATIHEPPHTEDEPATTHIAWSEFRHHLAGIWNEDRRLREATVARILVVLSTMASAFYVLFATEVAGLPEGVIGSFILAQTMGSLAGSVALGRIADRFGSQRVIQIGALVVIMAPIIGLMLAVLGAIPASLLTALLLMIYVIIGVTENIGILGFMNYVLDITPPGQRTIYMGVSNTIAGLGVIGPLFAGWLLSISSYPVMFAAAIMFGIGALILAARLPDGRVTVRPAASEVTAFTPEGG